jgi:hypothetical protein
MLRDVETIAKYKIEFKPHDDIDMDTRMYGTCSLYLKIFPWLKARFCLSVPLHDKYWRTNFLVSSLAASSFVHWYDS